MRLIDADTLKKILCEEYEAREYYIGEIMLKTIDNAPTISQTIITEFMGCNNCELERPQGHWVRDINPYSKAYQLKCSVCGKWGGLTEKGYNHEFNYCPNCGAEMRGGES